MSRRIFRHNLGYTTGNWRDLPKELHYLYTSTNVRMIKTRKRWAWHVAHTGDKECIQNFGCEAWQRELVSWDMRSKEQLKTKTVQNSCDKVCLYKPVTNLLY
jgi:hypothetical protein